MDHIRDLNALRVFHEVVRAGGFSAASRNLAMPKQTVSRKVADLEDDLDVRLLERSTRSVRPTEIGQMLFEYTERIVATAQEAQDAVFAGHGQPRGLLRIASPPLFGNVFLGPIVAEYLRLYPQARVQVVFSESIHDLVTAGIDVAIRTGDLPDSSHVVRKLPGARIICCASPDYLASAPPLRRPEDLQRHEGIIFRGNLWSFTRNGRETVVRMRRRVVVDSAPLALEMALAGLGVARLPALVCAPAIREGHLRQVVGSWSTDSRLVYLTWPGGRHIAPKVRAFVDLVLARYGDNPPWTMDPDHGALDDDPDDHDGLEPQAAGDLPESDIFGDSALDEDLLDDDLPDDAGSRRYSDDER